METKLVNVRLSEELFLEGKKIVKIGGFTNFQELIRDAIRHRIEELRRELAIIDLKKNLGSAKHKPIKELTREEKDAIAEELARNPAQQKELFRRVGLG
jgi:Arc/MetJ-type ribon-helix-helix transcriptional regulator